MQIYVFYLGDNKCKNTDILYVDKSTCERVKKDIKEGKPILEIYPGESSYKERNGKLVTITYSQYIVMANVCKIIIDDLN